ncbi:two-component system response regulator YesN [Anaerotaenia torta]|uniref:response regulator n=1 Tax=Anaerotaenia torta TaxID=433293 RepID=UPI003D2508F1
MYRIIVADDEEYVRDLLVKGINQSQIPFEVVGVAANGTAAIELVRELNPDVLITDICMPGIDGLELIRMVNDLDQSIKTIIISGYDEFAYAKKAMTLGVAEYLLKPFLPAELFAVLKKIQEQLENQANLLRNMEQMQSQIQKNMMLEQERYLLQVLHNNLPEEQLQQEGERVLLDVRAQYYCVGILKYPIAQNKTEQQDYCKTEELLAIVKDTYFPANLSLYLVNENNNHLVLIFCGNHSNQMLFHKSIQEGLEKMKDSMQRYYHIKFGCALGNTYQEWKQISHSYKEALSVWKGYLFQTDSTLLYADMQKKGQEFSGDDIQSPKELESSLLLHIQMNRKDMAIADLQDILKYYASFGVDMVEFVNISLVNLVYTISEKLMKARGDIKAWEDEGMVEYLKKHFTHGSLMEAKLVLEEYIIRCCEQYALINKNQGDKIVRNVKFLIEENLDNEEFNLENASMQLYFSHNYIRQLFKQKTGESFVEYLGRRRMETAGELLKNTNLRIQEVANKTGYSNPRYFASCFRKFYNCTPTEYRGESEEK